MNAPEIEIRKAVDEDRQAITVIAREVVEAGDVFVFEEVSDVLEYWYQTGGHVVVAVRANEILGTYVVKAIQKGRGAHVANAGYMVRQSAQGLGIGTALGEHSLQLAGQLGFRAMQFNMVVATNTGGIRVWKKLGFDVVGNLSGAFRHPEQGYVDALVMFRTI